jgi:hypothetical protein
MGMDKEELGQGVREVISEFSLSGSILEIEFERIL